MSASTLASPAPVSTAVELPSRGKLVLRYLRRNKSLVFGILIVVFLTLFTVIGSATINTKKMAYPLAVKPKQPPSAQYPLGTDFYGRDLLGGDSRVDFGGWQAMHHQRRPGDTRGTQ